MSTPPLQLKCLVARIGAAIYRAQCGLSRAPGRASRCCRMRSSAPQLGDGISACTALSIFSPLCNSFPGKCAIRNFSDPGLRFTLLRTTDEVCVYVPTLEGRGFFGQTLTFQIILATGGGDRMHLGTVFSVSHKEFREILKLCQERARTSRVPL